MIVWPRSGVGSSTSYVQTKQDRDVESLGNQSEIIGDVGAGTEPCLGSESDTGTEYLGRHEVFNCILTSDV
jgi:hypothetical protein